MTHAFANIVGTSAIEDVTAKMPISTWAEGAMFASVDDVAAFQAGLFGGQLLAPKWVAGFVVSHHGKTGHERSEEWIHKDPAHRERR